MSVPVLLNPRAITSIGFALLAGGSVSMSLPLEDMFVVKVRSLFVASLE